MKRLNTVTALLIAATACALLAACGLPARSEQRTDDANWLDRVLKDGTLPSRPGSGEALPQT